MAEPYKSVLEKHNENLARKRRLPTPEEEAIEPVYPEEYLMGGPGKAVASGFLKPSAKKAALRKEIAQTKIGSNLAQKPSFPDLLPPDQLAKYKEAAKKKTEQINRIKNQQKILNAAEESFERTSKNFSGEAGTHIGGAMADENRNAAGDTYKKGGKVSASSRADGIASRGKTKGRMV